MTRLHRLVLWDIDGTLVSNDDSDETLFLRMMRSVLPSDGEAIHPYRHGKTDLQQVTEYLLANGGSRDQVQSASERLVEFSRSHFAEPGERVVLPGVLETVRALAAEGHVNALLTGNGRARAELKLFSAGLDTDLFDWDSSFFGDAVDARPELTRRAAVHAAERSLRPIVVGDTVADGRAADAAGIDFVGVATGVYDVTALREVPHLAVVEDLATEGPAVVAMLSA
jgi:phosphoglycolate phosphatase-like HAD superfamily hydrolase